MYDSDQRGRTSNVRMFTRSRCNVRIFWSHYAVVDDEIFFFLALPDANTSCGFVSKNFSSALGATKESAGCSERTMIYINTSLYLV